ncbi:NupC/NupG family nucleoside CNT transporter [Ornithinimicrobium pratense]|uniref:NupC/NupG family nucleoside CNT transporter n=1 Tax=Ornithinimicrobium pratense TaxID=2593973 RepID=A0A5J6V9F4_9MICO|nr:nucleoside transporter C-terminal domain-containing protein [Ornithinimicrobium pratense]QFG69826.1 NupC/NupG family nucleoside CNT transporter [Ornithinimicrobium pratense]
MYVLWGLGGMVGLLGLAWLLSENRKAVRWRTVLAALAIQAGFGVIVLYWPAGQRALELVSRGVQAIIDSSGEGIDFVFGGVLGGEGVQFTFAFQVLPVIIFFGSLTAVLYHLGILQFVVEKLGGALGWALGTRRAESVNAAANVFVGQTEAPLVIRPYLKGLTRSGLFAVMVGGLSTVAGSVLVGYSLLGAPLEYLIAASFMAAPGALLMAKIVLPERLEDRDSDDPDFAAAKKREGRGARAKVGAAHATDATDAAGANGQGAGEAGHTSSSDDDDLLEGDESSEEGHRNVIDAAASGAADGLRLALTIGAMLLAFISLIALLNLILGTVGGWFGNPDLTFEQILGYVFAPIMTMIGVPWSEATGAGSFVGQKVVVNEFVAFSNFAPIIEEFSPRTAAIITFALTGFANLGSLGILLGGLGSLVKHRRGEIAELGLRAIAAATLANLMSATIAGILIS